MNIARLYDQFKEECPILAEHTISYKENKAGVNSIIVKLDDHREITYTRNAKETMIKIKR